MTGDRDERGDKAKAESPRTPEPAREPRVPPKTVTRAPADKMLRPGMGYKTK